MINRIKRKLGKDANLKELLLGSATSLILKVTGMLIGYVVLLYIAKQFGAESTGLYSIILSTLTLLGTVAACGINISVLRYAGEFNKKGQQQKLKQLHNHAMQIVGPLSLILAVVTYFSASSIANWFANPAYKQGMQMAAFALPFFAPALVSVEYIRGLKILKVSEYFRTVNRPLINLLLVFIGVYIFNINDVLLPVYTLFSATFITFLATELFIRSKTKNIKIDIEIDFTKNELLKTSFPMLTTNIASFVMGNASLYILEIYRPTAEVGIFSIALKISLFVSLILTVINTISAPKFAELYWSNNREQLQKLVNQSSKLIFIISLSVSLLLWFLSEYLLGFFGHEFKAAKELVHLLIFSQLINALTGSVGVFMNMTGHQRILRNVIVLTSLFSLTGSLIVIPIYGSIGAAIITMTGSILLNLVLAVYIKKKLGFVTYYAPAFIGTKSNK